MKNQDSLIGGPSPRMDTGFLFFDEWAIHHHIYCIHYITKIFSVQGITCEVETLTEVITSPHPNTAIRDFSLYPTADFQNPFDVSFGEWLTAKN